MTCNEWEFCTYHHESRDGAGETREAMSSVLYNFRLNFLFYYILLKILYLLLKRNIDLVDLLVCNESVIWGVKEIRHKGNNPHCIINLLTIRCGTRQISLDLDFGEAIIARVVVDRKRLDRRERESRADCREERRGGDGYNPEAVTDVSILPRQ